MKKQTLYAEVWLPLALPRALTYAIPDEWREQVRPGIRVVVQLGRNKLYTGIIRHITGDPPAGYTAKYIDSILDTEPVATQQQLDFWEWLAGYYCCTAGEVMNAALPAGLKLSSETRFALAYDNWREDATLTSREQDALELLELKASSIQEISEALGIKRIQPLLKGLVDRGLIYSEEEVRERYRPPTEEWFFLPEESGDTALQQAFAELEKKRASRQSDALLLFLRLSGYDNGQARKVSREELRKNGAHMPSFRALCSRGLLQSETRAASEAFEEFTTANLPQLTPQQDSALKSIQADHQSCEVVLLHGVTSSGKTEIYFHLIEEQLKSGKQVLFLLPEIALTVQLISRLRKCFGACVSVYHSGFSEQQRSRTWMSLIHSAPDTPRLVVGARSALFLPFQRLGLIIVDEEHEHSFKQHDPAPRYHARDAAILLASRAGARVLLGSATPSLETFWHARHGRYGLAELPTRFGGVEPPEMVICDIRQDLRKKTMRGNLTSPLVAAMEDALKSGRQVILFQNRRGYSPLWQCHACGWVPMCTRCDVSLTYHKSTHQLRCHYCGYSTVPPSECASCASHDLRMLGFGTEKIEEEIREFFAGTTVERMDLDTTRSKSAYHRLIGDFESGRIQVLVGTQMVTKGLDFDHVQVVGILNADRMMNYPDFRALERSFQLILQVAGRAGRRGERGKVYIQTYTPDHWLLALAVRGDYHAFFEREIAERHAFGYPPFMRLIRITIRHREDDVAEMAGHELARRIGDLPGVQVLGPERPYIPRINNYYLRQILLKMPRTAQLSSTKSSILRASAGVQSESRFRSVRIAFDVDPV